MALPDFQRYKVNYLYYLAHMDNMPSIHEHGLLSHNRAHSGGFVRQDIADQNVIALRAEKLVFGRPLHDYVPLYFTPKGPMLYRRQEMQNDIAILCLDSELLLEEGVVFSDGNAASLYTKFFADVANLDRLDWNCIRNEWWNRFEYGRRKRCAEVLAPGWIPFERIARIIVRTEGTRHRLKGILQERRAFRQIAPEVQPKWYFNVQHY